MDCLHAIHHPLLNSPQNHEKGNLHGVENRFWDVLRSFYNDSPIVMQLFIIQPFPGGKKTRSFCPLFLNVKTGDPETRPPRVNK